MRQQYLSVNLDMLYEAVGQQAEQDFTTALQREFPRMDEIERENIVNRWRKLSAKAERRMAMEQSRGNE